MKIAQSDSPSPRAFYPSALEKLTVPRLRIVAVSDTHGKHNRLNIPHGDVLIHAGDYTLAASDTELPEFSRWLNNQPHPVKILVAGNHERVFETSRAEAEAQLGDVVYLQDESLEVAGLQVYGTPWQPFFKGLAFNLQRGEPLREKWEKIPISTDILISHGPPCGVLDGPEGQPSYGNGCQDLRERVDVVSPALHIFGHVHDAPRFLYTARSLFLNAAIVAPHHETDHRVRRPIVIDLVRGEGVYAGDWVNPNTQALHAW